MSAIQEITNVNESAAFISGNPSGIIFFGSKNCGHCRNITPYFNQLAAATPRVAFAHVETTKVKTEGLDGVPVFVGYRNGAPLRPVVGADNRALAALVAKLQQ